MKWIKLEKFWGGIITVFNFFFPRENQLRLEAILPKVKQTKADVDDLWRAYQVKLIKKITNFN